MSLNWYVKRLSRMSFGEMLHRADEQRKRQLSRNRNVSWADFAGGDRLPTLPKIGDAILQRADAAFLEAVRNASRRLLAGKYSALGVDWPPRDPDDLFPAELWQLDPVSGSLWPGRERFCFDIPYRHERDMGDVKYVWEINRLQFLQPLAAAYLLSGDKAAAGAVDRAIASWAAANPPFRGLAWCSGIELGLRVVSILVATSLCGEALSPSTRTMAGAILRSHLYWIRRFPSKFSSANNHAVAELMGVFLAALSMPDLPGADQLVAEALQGLEREAGLQILGDGVPAEQSPTYGAFTAEMLLLCSFVSRSQRERFGSGLLESRLEKFASFVAAISEPSGNVPAIGDDDEGRVLTLCDGREKAYVSSVARTIANHLEFPTTLSLQPTSELREAIFGVPLQAQPRSIGLEAFDVGGYTVVSGMAVNRSYRIVLDHGPLGFLSIAAHGHADANSLLLSVDGGPVFVDPGTYRYHSGGEWRDWFRGTRAHNTLALEGADQSEIAGPFNWSRHANAQKLEMKAGADWSIAASHDGYFKRFGVRHQRRICANADGFVILDTLSPATAARTAEIVFQLAPGIEVVPTTESYRLLQDGRPILDISFGAQGKVEFGSGGPLGTGGWVSPRFGLKVPACRLVWAGQIPAQGLRTNVTLLPVA